MKKLKFTLLETLGKLIQNVIIISEESGLDAWIIKVTKL